MPGPAAGLQAGPRQAAQREGAPQAAGESAGQWERGIWSRDPVLTSDWLQDDHAGRVLEQAGRQRGRAQQLGPETGEMLLQFSNRKRCNTLT